MHRAVVADPSQASAHFGLGVTLYTERRIEEALACFTRALEINPDDVDSLLGAGNCNLEQRDFVAAEAHFRRAVAVDDGRATSHTHLGVALEAQDRAEDAQRLYRRAAQLSSDDDSFQSPRSTA